MRILVAGEWADNAMEIPILATWRELGHEVEIEVWPIGGQLLHHLSRFQQKVGNDYTLAGKLYNARIRRAMDRFKPDVFFVFKGMNVWESTLVQAKSAGILRVNYNPDHPFIFSGRGSGNAIVRECIKHFDLHLTYSESVASMLLAYGVRVKRVPFAYQLPKDWLSMKYQMQDEHSGAFIGNADSDRLHFMRSFLDGYGNTPFVIYGLGWGALQKSYPGLEIRRPVFGDDFWRAMRSHRFQLNLMRVHNLDSHNMRSVEALSAGAITLQPFTPDHASWIRSGENGFLFSTWAEAAELAHVAMNMTAEQTASMRERVENLSFGAVLSYPQMAMRMLEHVETIESS